MQSQKHLTEIAHIIEVTRKEEEAFLLDSKGAAIKIVQYLEYHFEVKEKINFEAEQLNYP